MRQKAISVELVSIGSELIKGEHIDDNSPYLSKELLKIGLRCRQFTLVPDFPLLPLVKTIRSAFKRSGLLIVSGGLGPTDDDVTRQAVAATFGKKLLFFPQLLRQIERNFKMRRLAMPEINKRQAYLPQGAKPIPNPLGSAPGLLIERGKKILVVLPGVPQELKAMFEKSVSPYLKRRFPNLDRSLSLMFRTTGVPESRVNELLEDLVKRENKVTFGFYAHPGIVDVTLTVDAPTPSSEQTFHKVAKEVRRRLGSFLFGEGNATLEKTVFHLLEKKNKTVSVAESCTGGALSSELTKIPGSSRHFKMGVVAYSNDTKSSLLKVPQKLIRANGAVSRVVANALAEQAKKIGKTDFGLGVTGILGPGGGTKQKPVGLVYMALAHQRGLTSRKYYFVGERETIRLRVVKAALDLLRRALK